MSTSGPPGFHWMYGQPPAISGGPKELLLARQILVETFMYRNAKQWHRIRRSIIENGAPKKMVSRQTGISRKTINKMLRHKDPPRYAPRRRYYPKLGSKPSLAARQVLCRLPFRQVLAAYSLQDLGKGSVAHLRQTLGVPLKDGVQKNVARKTLNNDTN